MNKIKNKTMKKILDLMNKYIVLNDSDKLVKEYAIEEIKYLLNNSYIANYLDGVYFLNGDWGEFLNDSLEEIVRTVINEAVNKGLIIVNSQLP